MMQVLKRPMIGAVLCLTIEAFFMGAAVSFIDLPMEAQVSAVILCAPAVIVVVGVRRGKRSGYDEHRCRYEHFAAGHDGSPMRHPSERPGVALSPQS
jgi:hypothetical protein